MESLTRTIFSAHLQTTKLLNRPFTLLPNSTLNQKFNLYPNEVLASNQYPFLGYIGIGNKGASYEMTSSGYVLTTPVPHLPRDASLYNFIPFVIRTPDNDLSATERLLYRMRVPLSVGGVDYIAYYLRVLDLSTVIPTVELRNVDDGLITTTSFEPVLSDLSPTPPVIAASNLNNPNGDYLVSTAKVMFTISQQDVGEIMDACNILYGDVRYAVINEIALCTGVDKIVQGTFGSVTSNYTDVIATQVAAYISQYHALSSNTTQVQIELDLGSVESLLV